MVYYKSIGGCGSHSSSNIMKNTIKTNGKRNDVPKTVHLRDGVPIECESLEGVVYTINLRRVRNA